MGYRIPRTPTRSMEIWRESCSFCVSRSSFISAVHSHFYAFPKKRRACSEITLQAPDFIQSTCTPLSTLSRFTALARRISRVIFRWVFADTPVTRRGKIFPVSEVNFERNSGLHISTAPCGMSMRRCGIDRLHVRKRILRSTLLNSVIIADFRLILVANLSHLTVQRATLQERIVLHLLQAPWRTRALLVASSPPLSPPCIPK